MKFFFGAFLMLADIVLGVYVGLWVCFIGGIVDIINQLKGSVDALTIAWGIIKICCFSWCCQLPPEAMQKMLKSILCFTV